MSLRSMFTRRRRPLEPGSAAATPTFVNENPDAPQAWRADAPPDATVAAPASAEAVQEWREAVRAEFSGPPRAFFITGAARSGTTSCTRILGLAHDAETISEPRPRLAELVHQHRMGRLADPRPVIWQHRIERIRQIRARGLHYGEKDQQTFGWLPFYRDLFNPRFVWVLRDGRDVVRSLLGYHHVLGRPVFAEATTAWPDGPPSSPTTQPLNPTEQSRPRPAPEDPWHDAWPSLSRMEMLAWYWSHVTRTIQRDLQEFGEDRWTEIDYSSSPDPQDHLPLFEFLELEPPPIGEIESALAARINSFNEKRDGAVGEIPTFDEWPQAARVAFDRVAAPAMVELGHYGLDALPPDEAARDPHATPWAAKPDPIQATLWPRVVEQLESPPAGTALLVGPAEITWLGTTSTRFEGGLLGNLPEGPFDWVIALGILERTPDLDAWFLALAQRARQGLVITSARDDGGTRLEHSYRFAPDGSGSHGWARARHHALARRQIGFSRIRGGTIPTDEPRRPLLGYLVAER